MSAPNSTSLAWTHLLQQLNAANDGAEIFVELRTLYAEPHRAYHNLAHIQFCLNELESSPFSKEHALALWFHDAVYDPTRHDNEEVSAELAASRLASLALNTYIPAVRRLILATKHISPPVALDEQIIVDIDLSIFGQSRAIFLAYETAIREEYSHVPPEAFRSGRTAILKRFLQRNRIYLTNHFYERYEHQARRNLEESLRLLAPNEKN